MADDMNPSGSDDDDDDEMVSDDDDGELPAPLPLAMLGVAPSGGKKAPKPITPQRSKLPTPLKLAKKPASPAPGPPSSKPVPRVAAASDDSPTRFVGEPKARTYNNFFKVPEEAPAPTRTPTETTATAEAADTPTNEASNQDDDSDEDDDDDKITTPASMPPHRAIAEPVAEDDGVSEPFDAAKAAEQARKAGTGGAAGNSNNSAANGSGAVDKGGGGGGGAMAGPPIERSPGVVDAALMSLLLMLKGEKNDSLAQVPMELCVHGLVKDDEDNTWPPYEISLPESRKSQTSRQAWLNQKMQQDPNRLLNTILFFNIDPDAVLDSKSVMAASEHKLQAILPGVLVNPDGNADAAKRIAEYNESIGSSEWTFAIPVPAQFVKMLYKQHKHGLPTLYNPVSNDKVRFSLFSKIEDQCGKDQRWKLIVDKSREGQATAAANGGGGAAGGGGGGRGKRAAAGGEDGAPKKRGKHAAAAAAAAAAALTNAESPGEEPLENPTPPAASMPPPAPIPPTLQNSQNQNATVQQTVLNFLPAPVEANGSPLPNPNPNPQESSSPPQRPEESQESQDEVPVEHPPPHPSNAPMPLALRPPLANATTPGFVHAPLNWTSITPDWFSIIVPKIPKGFVVEMSAPTIYCSGMLSLKRSSEPAANPLDM